MKNNKANQFTLTRVYNAPLKTVWEAWVDPKQAVKWWGPRGFTTVSKSKDLRSGGEWLYTMTGPDGTVYENRHYYYEVEKYSHMIYDHGAIGQKPVFRVEVRFAEEKNKTRLEFTMICETEQAAKDIQVHIKKANGESTWDRLGEYLEKQVDNKEVFIINRSFNVSIAKMFDMWANPKHLAAWMGPKESELTMIRAKIQSGGSLFYSMSMAGQKMFGRAEYLAVEKPTLLTYRQQFCDENEKPSRHPFAATWPMSMLTTITFAEENANRTRVTIHWQPEGKVTAEELETFIKGRDGMTMGWTGSLDKLDEYLPSV